MADNRATVKGSIAGVIPDNTTEEITPQDHRDAAGEVVDNAAFLADANEYTGDNYFTAGARFSVSATGSGTKTLTRASNFFAAPSGVTQVNLPATPSLGDWYEVKNRSGADLTFSGNGNNLYTSSSKASTILINGGSIKVWWDGTFWNQT